MSNLFELPTSRSMNRNHSGVYIILLACICTSCGDLSKNQTVSRSALDKLTIAVAANMQFAMDSLVASFSKLTGNECEVTISSSGKLTAQILQGAPFDIFVSANMKYPNEVLKNNKAVGPPKVYALGKLVLWTMRKDINPAIEVLTDSDIQHIALANPETAPYGDAARQVLQNINLYQSVSDKLVYGESIAQTNQFIMTQSADIGFTAMSVVLSPQLAHQGRWTEIEQTQYGPIEQGVVIIDHGTGQNPAAQSFYDFLSTDEAKIILTRFGFAIPEAIETN